MDKVYQRPEVAFFGQIVKAVGFEKTVYLRYSLKYGESWTLINGNSSGETFLAIGAEDEDFTPLSHPIEVKFGAKSIRGWPRIVLEVWQVDEHRRHCIGGYGQILLPCRPGNYQLKVPCWRPKTSFFDKLLGTLSELTYPDVIISSENRNGIKGETTGEIHLDINVILKDFQFHGIIT